MGNTELFDVIFKSKMEESINEIKEKTAQDKEYNDKMFKLCCKLDDFLAEIAKKHDLTVGEVLFMLDFVIWRVKTIYKSKFDKERVDENE